MGHGCSSSRKPHYVMHDLFAGKTKQKKQCSNRRKQLFGHCPHELIYGAPQGIK